MLRVFSTIQGQISVIECYHGAGGRDAAGLLPLLQCLVKFLVDPRYSRLLLGVAHRVLDTYSGQVRSTLYQHFFMQRSASHRLTCL